MYKPKRLVYDPQSKMWLANPYALKATVAARPSERAIARSVTATLAREPLGDANHDLLGDVFFSMFKSEAPLLPDENVPAERTVNKALVDWMRNSPDFEKRKWSSQGNLAASLMSSMFMWEFLSTEEALQDALKKQEEAEKAMQEAMQDMRSSAGMSMRGDQAGAGQAQQKAQAKQDAAKALANAAKRQIDKIQKSPMGQGMMGSALKQAEEKGKEAADMMAGWGIDPGSATATDLVEIMRITKKYGDKLREIAKLAGRLKQSASKGIEDAHRSYSGPITEVSYTRDFRRIFPIEKMLISKGMPAILRMPKVAQFLRHGLLGWHPYSEAKAEGSFEAMVDGSGSMHGGLEEIAKAVALAIAMALREDKNSAVNRHYNLTTFGTESDPFRDVDDKDTWQKHVAWASDMPGGGTDFDNAFKGAIDRMKRMKEDGAKGIDLFFITDGWARISEHRKREWNDFATETGARLLYVNIGSRVNEEVEEMADVMIKVEGAEDFEKKAEEIAFAIANKITSADYDRRGAGGD